MQSASPSVSQITSAEPLLATCDSSSAIYMPDGQKEWYLLNPVDSFNHTESKNLGNDLRKQEILDCDSPSLRLSSTSSIQCVSSLSNQVNDMQYHPTSVSSCISSTDPKNSRSNSPGLINANTSACADEQKSPKQSLCDKSSTNLNGDVHSLTEDVQTPFKSPENGGMIVLKRAVDDCASGVIYELNEVQSAPEHSVQDSEDNNKYITSVNDNGAHTGELEDAGDTFQDGGRENEKAEAVDFDADDGDSEKEEKFSDDILCEHGE